MNMDKKLNRFVQVLQGRRKESLVDEDFWNEVADAAEIDDNDDMIDRPGVKQLKSKLKILYESIAVYFIRLTSLQERIRDFNEIAPMLVSLEQSMVLREHSDYERALESRGAYKAFENYILNHSAEEDITLMSLAFCMLFGYRNCKCCHPGQAVVEHKEVFVTALAKCVRAPGKFHFWLNEGLAYSIVSLVDAAVHVAKDQDKLEGLQMADEVSKLTIEHHLAKIALRWLAIALREPRNVRRNNCLMVLLRLAEFCPSFVAACRTDDYVVCAVSFFRHMTSFTEKHINRNARIFCGMYQSCYGILGAKLFSEKFLPQLFMDLPDSFLTALYHDPKPLYGQWRISLEPAAGAFQVGRFNHHKLLAPLIVNVFKEKFIYLTRESWDFLRGAYGEPFKEDYFANVPECDPYTLEFLRSVITGWRMNTMRSKKRCILNLSFQELRIKGYTAVMEVALETCPKCRLTTFFKGECSNLRCEFKDPKRKDAYECSMVLFEYDKSETHKKVLDSVKALSDEASSGNIKEKEVDDGEQQTSAAVDNDDELKKISAVDNDEPKKTYAVDNGGSTTSTADNGEPKTSAAAVENSQDSVEEESNLTLLSCNTCGRRAIDLMLCGRCQQVRYCNRECQKADWKKGGHKQVCQNHTID